MFEATQEEPTLPQKPPIKMVKPKPKKKPKPCVQKKMVELVAIRWDATRADEKSIRDRYRTELATADALEELARLRKLCEMAAQEINQRLTHVDQKCASCGRVMDSRRPPTMTEPILDPATGTQYNNFYCSIICVQRRNLKKMGREDLVR